MRLYQIDDNKELLEVVTRSRYQIMSNRETKDSVDEFYRLALMTDQQVAWMRNGAITNWQAAMDEWMSVQKLEKLQRLDDSWRGYVAQLHYEHYLNNKEAQLMLSKTQITKRIVDTQDTKAETRERIERYLGNKQSKGDEE
jgi:hypothetical protein